MLVPQAHLRYVLTHPPEHPINRVSELLLWHIAEHLVLLLHNSEILIANYR